MTKSRILIPVIVVILASGYWVNSLLSEALVLPMSSIIEIAGGAGELGTLADGTGEADIELAEGPSVPAVLGQQPLPRKPMAKLPMPGHPYLLDELASGGVHGDAYNSSVTPLPGPLGLSPVAVYRSTMPSNDISMCTPMLLTPDSKMASLCVGLGVPSQLVLFDPEKDFEIIAQVATAPAEDMTFMAPGQGWYTGLDNQGRAMVLVPGQKYRIYALDQSGAQPEWVIEKEFDLSPMLEPGEFVFDIRPDWHNNMWFSTGDGYVGYLNTETGDIKRTQLADGEESGTAIAVTEDAVFMLTTRALYRFEIDDKGEVMIRWRFAYGQSNSINGDLTAPTVFDGGKLIAFGLNEDASPRGKVMVLRTDAAELSFDDRVVCQQPVFKPGKGFLDNTFVGYDKSLVVQNNHGGVFFNLVEYEPGLARVDVLDDYSGCETVWEDYSVSSQVPPKLSTGDGHVYQYSRKMGLDEDTHAWYLSATDFETGETVSEMFIGSGERLDNPMLSIDFLPGGVMVGGVRNGIVVLRDSGT